MFRKDKIKGIVALIVFGSIGLTFWLFGKEVAKIIAVIGFIVWVGAMYYTKKKEE